MQLHNKKPVPVNMIKLTSSSPPRMKLFIFQVQE